MPVTISGDATKRIEALIYNLSDARMRDLTVELRDSLVRKLAGVQWRGGASVYIGRGLTAYTEPVRTPAGGWMCGVGSLEILHREDAPPRTIADFRKWYSETYRPAEKAKRRAKKEKALRAEAKIKIAQLQRKRIEGAQDRLRRIYTKSLPYQEKLLYGLGRRITELENDMAAAKYGPVTRLANMRARMQKLVDKRAERRQKIRNLKSELGIIEGNLIRWGSE